MNDKQTMAQEIHRLGYANDDEAISELRHLLEPFTKAGFTGTQSQGIAILRELASRARSAGVHVRYARDVAPEVPELLHILRSRRQQARDADASTFKQQIADRERLASNLVPHARELVDDMEREGLKGTKAYTDLQEDIERNYIHPLHYLSAMRKLKRDAKLPKGILQSTAEQQ
jgi:hypothetical protein